MYKEWNKYKLLGYSSHYLVLKIESLSASLADNLFSGSQTTNFSTKPIKSPGQLQFPFLILSASPIFATSVISTPKLSTLIAVRSYLVGKPSTLIILAIWSTLLAPSKRGCRVIISAITHPADQISIFVLYSLQPKTSQGAR